MRMVDDGLMRALLFVPGSDERKLEKVGRFGADVIAIDLEDAVADEHKVAARATTRAAVAAHGADQAVLVRVNGIATGALEADIAAVTCPQLGAIMVPKVEDTEALAAADAALAAAEAREGMEVGSVRLFPLLETARGIVRCDAVLAAAPPRTLTAVFGSGDFTTELGIDFTPEATELAYPRARLVLAARAAGLARPLDGPFLDLRDEAGLVADTKRSRGLGFQGRIVVYPPQVAPAQAAYSELSEEEAERARTVVEAFEAAEAGGVASLRVEGRFVDYAVYRLARERLRLYEADRPEAGTDP